MKLFLVLWAVGLAASDKLDRTYLPPPGSITSGGHLKDLNLPLEFPKETYSFTPENENNRNTVNNFSRPSNPNVAIGIERQRPSVTSTGPGVPFSKNILNESSRTTPYAFAQTTTLSPAETYGSTVGQGYTSTISPFDPNLNYPQKDGFTNDRQQSGIGFESKISDVSPQLAYTGQSTSVFNGSPDLQSPHSPKIQHSLASDFVTGNGGPISSHLTPQDFSLVHNYPSYQYGGDLDSTIKEAISTASTPSDNYYNQQNPKTYKDKNQQNYAEDVYYSTPKINNNFDGENRSYDPVNTGVISTLTPNQYPDAISSTLGPIRSSSEYSSTPKYSLDNLELNYNTQIQPERFQAAADRNAVITNYENILTPEGFAYSYDTSNGIHADESGTAINGVKAQGSYSYIGDDGQVYSIVYTADENGFLPRGNHLPTAPPIPKAILRVIEEAEKNKQLGVIDDGTYDDSKYGYERYQGPLGRKPQVTFSNNNREQSINRGNSPNVKTITIETENYPNNGNPLDQVNSNDKVGIISGSPYPFNADNVNENEYYTNEEDKQFSFNDDNQPNNRGLLRTDKVKANDNQFITRPKDKSTDNSKIISGPSGAHHSDYIATNPKIGFQSSNGLFSNENVNIPEKQAAIHNMGADFNINFPSHTGYEYRRPQQKFNNNYGNNYASIMQPGSSKLYNRVSDKNYEDPTMVTEREFSTSKPEYGVTSSNYQYPYTAKVIDDQRHYDYPTSTLRSSYTPSTTRLPSKFSPSLPPSTIGLDYPQTTPVASQFSSTVPPSVASNIFGSSTRRPSVVVGSNYGQRPNKEYRVSTTRPDIMAERINGKPIYRGKPKIPVTNNQKTPQATSTQDKVNPGFGISEHRAQSFKTSPEPENYGGQPTTERVIGEDFNRPKQPQRFDPEHGYYY